LYFNLVLSIALLSCFDNKGNKSKIKDENIGSKGFKETILPFKEDEMVYFKGGNFMMGSANGSPNEQPVNEVTTKSYKIDKYPVTVVDYRRFVQETDFKTDAEKFGFWCFLFYNFGMDSCKNG